MKVLFICSGCVNRSAAAHVILSFHNTGLYKVDSCGTSKQAVDRSRMAPKMRRVLAEMGYSGEQHIAQPYSQDLLDWADQVICMSHLHVDRINKNFSVDPLKVRNWNVEDPFRHKGEEVHRAVAQQIKELVFHHFLS